MGYRQSKDGGCDLHNLFSKRFSECCVLDNSDLERREGGTITVGHNAYNF